MLSNIGLAYLQDGVDKYLHYAIQPLQIFQRSVIRSALTPFGTEYRSHFLPESLLGLGIGGKEVKSLVGGHVK